MIFYFLNLRLNFSGDVFGITDFETTVKPENNDHPWNQEKVVVVQRWSLFRGSSDQIFDFNKKISPQKEQDRLAFSK